MFSQLLLRTDDAVLAEELLHQRALGTLLADRVSPTTFRIGTPDRGRIKQALIKVGFPAEDVAGYTAGSALSITLRDATVLRTTIRAA